MGADQILEEQDWERLVMFAEYGMLLHWTGLLSTFGNELKMIDDMHEAVAWMKVRPSDEMHACLLNRVWLQRIHVQWRCTDGDKVETKWGSAVVDSAVLPKDKFESEHTTSLLQPLLMVRARCL